MSKKTPPGRKRGLAIAEFFEDNPHARMNDVFFENEHGSFNKARKDIERWAAHYLPGVKRSATGAWSYTPPSTSRRGQSRRLHEGCAGRLMIKLEGPQGCGKSMVRKILEPLLPLVPLDEFEILETNEL